MKGHYVHIVIALDKDCYKCDGASLVTSLKEKKSLGH